MLSQEWTSSSSSRKSASRLESLSCLHVNRITCHSSNAAFLQRGATIVYATHIFDGLETWATHLAYIQDGELRRCAKMEDILELKSADNLLSVVESWLRSETKLPKKEPIKSSIQSRGTSPFDSSPFRSSRHMAYYR